MIMVRKCSMSLASDAFPLKQSSTCISEIVSSQKPLLPRDTRDTSGDNRNDRGHMKATIDRLEDSGYISVVNKC